MYHSRDSLLHRRQGHRHGPCVVGRHSRGLTWSCRFPTSRIQDSEIRFFIILISTPRVPSHLLLSSSFRRVFPSYTVPGTVFLSSSLFPKTSVNRPFTLSYTIYLIYLFTTFPICPNGNRTRHAWSPTMTSVT